MTVWTQTGAGLRGPCLHLLLQLAACLVELLSGQGYHVGLALQFPVQLTDGVVSSGHLLGVSGEQVVHLMLEKGCLLLLLGEGRLETCNLRD